MCRVSFRADNRAVGCAKRTRAPLRLCRLCTICSQYVPRVVSHRRCCARLDRRRRACNINIVQRRRYCRRPSWAALAVAPITSAAAAVSQYVFIRSFAPETDRPIAFVRRRHRRHGRRRRRRRRRRPPHRLSRSQCTTRVRVVRACCRYRPIVPCVF